MKVILVAATLKRADFVENLAKNLAKNIQLIFFCKNQPRPSLSKYGKMVEGDGKKLSQIIRSEKVDLVHWFQADSKRLFSDYYNWWKKSGDLQKVPIVITHLQLPFKHNLELSLEQLRIAQKIVFIVNEAYLHPKYSWIAASRKTRIYFGSPLDKFQEISAKKAENSNVVYGRGSTLNKCPQDMIEVFSKVDLDNKKFKIAGEGDSQIVSFFTEKSKELNLNNKVSFAGFLDFSKWKEFLENLDIFLYQLKVDGYSAIDYTIQHAMLCEKPVVLLGPPAPGELIEHGKSGFIAKSKEEFVKYATQLGNDPVLRKKIGVAARKRIFEEFNIVNTGMKYSNLYQEVVKHNEKKNQYKIPLRFVLKYNKGRIQSIPSRLNYLFQAIKNKYLS